MVKLTSRQRLFAEEYLVDFNATQAMIRAGFAESSAGTAAGRMMLNPKIKAAIAEGMAERAQRTRITADRVLKEYARIAFADIRHFLRWSDEGVKIRPEGEISEDDASAIAEITFDRDAIARRLRLYDKKAALDALAKHLGLFDARRAAEDADTSAEEAEARELLRQRIGRLIAESGGGQTGSPGT